MGPAGAWAGLGHARHPESERRTTNGPSRRRALDHREHRRRLFADLMDRGLEAPDDARQRSRHVQPCKIALSFTRNIPEGQRLEAFRKHGTAMNTNEVRGIAPRADAFSSQEVMGYAASVLGLS